MTMTMALVSTWKNVTFAGGNIYARNKTNTFQTVVVTDETRHIDWTAHTEAGGSSKDGTGGTSAFIRFNAGNETGSYEYKPYSQSPRIMKILSTGNVNGKPGRHIFRVDDNIMPEQCVPELYDISAYLQPLSFAHDSGNMLGGTVVNVTGPCFDITKKVACRFDTVKVPGVVIDQNRATCVMPSVDTPGYVDLSVHVDGSKDLFWQGKFLVKGNTTYSI